jgi:hypothetical protein
MHFGRNGTSNSTTEAAGHRWVGHPSQSRTLGHLTHSWPRGQLPRGPRAVAWAAGRWRSTQREAAVRRMGNSASAPNNAAPAHPAGTPHTPAGYHVTTEIRENEETGPPPAGPPAPSTLGAVRPARRAPRSAKHGAFSLAPSASPCQHRMPRHGRQPKFNALYARCGAGLSARCGRQGRGGHHAGHGQREGGTSSLYRITIVSTKGGAHLGRRPGTSGPTRSRRVRPPPRPRHLSQLLAARDQPLTAGRARSRLGEEGREPVYPPGHRGASTFRPASTPAPYGAPV